MPNVNEDGFYYTKHSMIVDDKDKIKELFNYKIEDGYFLRIIIDFESDHFKNIDEVTQIQNIFWINNLAPRVKKLIKINYKDKYYDAQVIEQVTGSGFESIIRIDELFKIAEENFIEINREGEDGLQEYYDYNNWRKNIFIDYGGFKFKDKKAYIDKLNKKIDTITHFGKNYNGTQIRYQSNDNLDGKRKTKYRIEKLGLDNLDFNNKIVVDIGCNLGMFCQYAIKKGAKEVYGINVGEDIIRCAKEYANINGIYDINFLMEDLSRNRVLVPQGDIVFYLAMSEYLGFPGYIIGNEVTFYEGHANENSEETKNKLLKLFSRVEDLGFTDDRSIRPIFKCYR